MALHYENLDDRTREFMLQEVKSDIASDNLYLSPRLTDKGKETYASLLIDAIKNFGDAWLANELRSRGYLKAYEQRKKTRGGYTMAKVPVTAPETLAEGEFNRFYVRGLCLRAIHDGIAEVEIYRGKPVKRPRSESEAMIGKRIPVDLLLKDLRESPGVEPALGLPPGPNSGLTVRLPRDEDTDS